MTTYKATIIEDKLIDILILKKIISNYCINIDVISQTQSIEEGVVEIKKNKPDIVFLDIIFEGLIVFDFFDKFDFQNVQVIFFSSEKEFALNAFEYNAVDFILKPLKYQSVVLAVNKAIKNIEMMNVFCEANIRHDSTIVETKFEYIAVASLERIDFVKMSDIVFCMSEGKYTTFFLLNGKKIVSSKNLGEYEKMLDPFHFYRIHHSYIINIKYLVTIIKRDGLYCELSNRITIPIAKRRQDDFNRFIRLKC